MASPFEYYKKINEEVFSLHPDVTLKISVLINQPVESRTHETFINELHNEFVTSKGAITTNIKYKYTLSLSPKRFYSYGLLIDWENYADLIDFVDDIVYLGDTKNDLSPFKIVRNEFDEVVNIKCDNTISKTIRLEDAFGNSIEARPTIISYRNNTKVYPGVRLVFGEQNDLAYDVTLKRFRGFQRFLMTFNPLHLASNMINYLVTTPLLGTNQKIINQ